MNMGLEQGISRHSTIRINASNDNTSDPEEALADMALVGGLSTDEDERDLRIDIRFAMRVANWLMEFGRTGKASSVGRRRSDSESKAINDDGVVKCIYTVEVC
jgi:hypothetical protein